MKNVKHTPGPWRKGEGGKCMKCVVADHPVPEISGSDAVEYYGGHLVCESVSEANAQFIVTACNAHDDLANRLESVLEVYEQLLIEVTGQERDNFPYLYPEDHARYESGMEKIYDIMAALAKARGEGT